MIVVLVTLAIQLPSLVANLASASSASASSAIDISSGPQAAALWDPCSSEQVYFSRHFLRCFHVSCYGLGMIVCTDSLHSFCVLGQIVCTLTKIVHIATIATGLFIRNTLL